MPSVSAKQRRFMAAAAHDPALAAKAGIKPAVAAEYNRADSADQPPLTTPGGLVKRGGYLGKRR